MCMCVCMSVDNLWGQSGVFQTRSSADTGHWEVEELWGWCWLGMRTRVKTSRHWHRLDNSHDMKSTVHSFPLCSFKPVTIRFETTNDWKSLIEKVCTLRLEGAQVLSEGVCWTPQLQKSQVSMFPHLHLLLLLLPHSYCDLTPQTETNTQQDHTLILYSNTGSTPWIPWVLSLYPSNLFLCMVERTLISISVNVHTPSLDTTANDKKHFVNNSA